MMRLVRGAVFLAACFLVQLSLRADSASSATDLKAKVDGQISALWPTAGEKKFDRIGWAADLRTARKLAAEHDRPVFLFTMDGRVNLGRC